MDKNFYNRKFKANPGLWSDGDRDEMVWEICSSIGRFDFVLDIGCGNGHTLKYFQERDLELELVGVDWSEEAIDLAQQGLDAELIVVNFSELDWSRQFDLVLNLGTLEHFEDLRASLLKLRGLIVDGGFCYFEAPNNLSYSPGEESYRRLKRGSHQMEWHLSKRSWEKFLFEVGFQIIDEYKGPKAWYEFVWLLL